MCTSFNSAVAMHSTADDVFPQQAFASHGIQIDRNGSLTVNETYSIQNKVKNLADVELQVWRVARVTTGVKFVLTDGFAASGVSVNRLSGSEWQDAADALLLMQKQTRRMWGMLPKSKLMQLEKQACQTLKQDCTWLHRYRHRFGFRDIRYICREHFWYLCRIR